MVEPVHRRARQLLRAARRAQHRGAEMLGDLRRRRPHAAAHGVDQDPVARRHPPPRDQRVVGGEEHLRNGGRLDVGETARDRQRLVLVHRDELRLRATAHQAHHPVPNLPAGHVPHRLDLTRVLHPGNVGRHTRRRRILASALNEIGAVEPRGVDPDTDVSGAHLGLRNVADADDLGTAGAIVDDRAHGSRR